MKLKLSLGLGLIALAFKLLAAEPVSETPVTATNAPANGTNDLDAPPKALGNGFTNSVGMVLLKVRGDLWAGKFEVTQKEYQKITGGNPSSFAGPARPVDNVSWNDAMDFCARMTAADVKKKKLPPDFYYTLPTESEWESLVADASLDDSVTSETAPRAETSPVGSLKPNSLGLYDVRGNVMEFCLGDDSKPYRVLRGGSWQDRIEINLRTVFRFYATPEDHQNTFGFRCVLKKR